MKNTDDKPHDDSLQNKDPQLCRDDRDGQSLLNGQQVNLLQPSTVYHDQHDPSTYVNYNYPDINSMLTFNRGFLNAHLLNHEQYEHHDTFDQQFDVNSSQHIPNTVTNMYYPTQYTTIHTQNIHNYDIAIDNIEHTANTNTTNNKCNTKDTDTAYLFNSQQPLKYESQQPSSITYPNSSSNVSSSQHHEQELFKKLINLATKCSKIDDNNQSSVWPYQIEQNQMTTMNEPQLQQQYTNLYNEPPTSSGIKSKNENYTSLNIVPTHNDRIYELIIVQQPSRGRMCGFGEKDRRSVSPVPILKLIVKSSNGELLTSETFDSSFLIVMCELCTVKDDQEESTSDSTLYKNQIVNFSSPKFDKRKIKRFSTKLMRSLAGSLVSSASKLYDLEGNLGIFFVFPDIGIRSEGTHKLKFSLIDIESPYSHKVNTTSISKVLHVVETDSFYVYTPKKFPGVDKTTPLTICFTRQGVKIPYRHSKKADTSAASISTPTDISEEEEREGE